MPNSYQLHTANGSTTDFSFSQIDGWVNSGFIKVYVDDVLQTTGYTFQNLTAVNPLVRFTTAPTNGKIIRIQRETPATVSGFQGNIVNFNNGSVLTEDDLDNLGRGLLHITQEGNDTGSGALGPTLDALHWDAKSKRIQKIATPTALTDAATKGYVDGISLYGSAMTTPQSWSFSGNGSTTAFTLSPAPATTDAVMFIVEVGGVIQRPTTNYTITAPNTLTFVAAPASGANNIVVRNFGSTRNIAAFADAVSFGSTVAVTGNTNIGGTLGVTGNTTISGTLNVNGGTLATTSSTGNVFNSASFVDVGTNASQVVLGSNSSGTTIIRNPATSILGNATVGGTLAVAGNITGSTVGALASSLLPSGCVLQVVTGTMLTVATMVVNSSQVGTFGSFNDIGLSATITPKRNNSTIYVVAMLNVLLHPPTGAGSWIEGQLVQGSTPVQVWSPLLWNGGPDSGTVTYVTVCATASPATTNTTTYKVQTRNSTGSYLPRYAYINYTGLNGVGGTVNTPTSSIWLIEVAV